MPVYFLVQILYIWRIRPNAGIILELFFSLILIFLERVRSSIAFNWKIECRYSYLTPALYKVDKSAANSPFAHLPSCLLPPSPTPHTRKNCISIVFSFSLVCWNTEEKIDKNPRICKIWVLFFGIIRDGWMANTSDPQRLVSLLPRIFSQGWKPSFPICKASQQFIL